MLLSETAQASGLFVYAPLVIFFPLLGVIVNMIFGRRFGERFTGVVGRERDAFEEALASELPRIEVSAADADRLPHFSHVRIPGVAAESLLIRLDQAGIQASAGSSCQSGAVEPSHVLSAMGFSRERAAECVRFTFGWDTVPGEGVLAAKAVAQVVRSVSGGTP